MTLLSVVKDVCSVVGVAQPNTVFGGINNNRTMQEMLSLANEMAQRIAYDTREWNALLSLTTYVGDGVTQAFPMPADYKRMLLKSEVWRSTSALRPMVYVSDVNEWIQRRALHRFAPWGEWIRIGGNINFWPIMGSDLTATFAYLSKNCVNLASGGVSDTFVADGDSFVLDERLLKLGMIFQWKANKGSPYSEDMGSYGDALMMDMGADNPAPTFVGRSTSSRAIRVAYPWPVPT